MKFAANAKVVPIASADSRAVTSRPSTEFDAEAERLARDITDLVDQGCFLRDEMCRLLLWQSRNSGQSWWSESQETYAATHGANLRATAASLKAAMDARGCTACVVREVFEPTHSCQFDQATLNAARKELGI